jgi:hypothetical protein
MERRFRKFGNVFKAKTTQVVYKSPAKYTELQIRFESRIPHEKPIIIDLVLFQAKV